MEKVYLGQGKAQKYGENYNLDLNGILSYLYEQTKSKNVINAMKELKKIDFSNIPGFFCFETKEGKKVIQVNISTNQMKNESEKGKTHYLTLNTWKPDKKKTEQPPVNDSDTDLPF